MNGTVAPRRDFVAFDRRDVSRAQETTTMSASAERREVSHNERNFEVHGSVSDFNFLAGRWAVHCRKLVKPLSGSNEWIEFDGTNFSRPAWHGHANVDEFEGDAPSGRIVGMTVRFFDSSYRQWRIYWANASRALFDMPPMIGGFEKGYGEFFNREEFEGVPVVVRFLWIVKSSRSCSWEQAFSVDDGKTWEVNWTWELTRLTR
jgi:hypothetical protein